MDLVKTLLIYMTLLVSSATEASPAITPLPADAVFTATPYVTETPYLTETPTATPSPTPASTTRYTTLYVGDKGTNVRKLQTRLKELGYLTGNKTDIFSSSVEEAVRWFQNSNSLDADGIAGPATLTKLYSDNVLDASGSMTSNTDSPIKVDGTPVTPTLGTVKSVDFFSSEGDQYFNRKSGTFKDGAYATVTDVATGISYRVKRVGGYNHTDVEPATAFDTWQMYTIYGEEWAWTRHAVLVTLSDGTTLAGSINGMPHGDSHISNNNMNGHTCIHFLNSRTHGTDKVDAAHQSAIKTAASCSVSSVQAKVNAQ